MDALNDDMLCHILDRAYCALPLRIEDFRLDIKMLHVCQRWRQMLLPYIYKQVFITNIGGHQDTLQTTIDLAASNGYLGYCQHILIKIHSSTKILSKLHDAISLVQRYSNSWNAVSQLTVSFENPRFIGESSVATATNIEGFAKAARSIAHTLPNISRLRVCSIMEDSGISTLLNSLIDHYKNNLIDLLAKTVQMHLAELPQLKRLDFMFADNVDSALFPSLCETLEYLYLTLIPHEQLCSLFGSNGSPKIFPNLKYLNIYSPLNHIDSTTKLKIQYHISRTRLYLPKLCCLILVNNYKYCPILSTAMLPRQMNLFSVSVSSQTIMMLAKSVIPQAQRLSIQLYHCTDAERDSTVMALNHIYHQTTARTNTMLTFGCSTRAIMPNEIGGANINYLSVAKNVTIAMLIGFIDKLPTLNRLEAHIDQQSECSPELSIPAVTDKTLHPLQPFAARVKYLELYYDDKLANSIVLLVKYVLLRLPSLEELNSYMTFKKPILELIEEYTPLYPHLPFVKLILNPKNLW